jgi:hypothetical protein
MLEVISINNNDRMKLKIISKITYYINPIFKLLVVLFFLFQIFISTNSAAQGIQIKAEFDTSAILIGDQIHLNIFIDQPQAIKITFPNLSDSLVSKVEILSASKTDTGFIGNGRLKLIKRYLITSFDSGVYQIPAMTFEFQSGTFHDSILTNPLVLVVNTIPIKDAKKIFDIKKLIAVPYTFDEFLPYILIGLGCILIALLVIYIVLRIKQKKPIFFFQKPPEPAHLRAFRELEKLKGEKLWQQNLVKQYFTRLTEIVRTYIENRYNIMALESTSDEIINDLKGAEMITDEMLIELKKMLVVSDLVKFAKGDPLPDENENSWKIAFDFVQKTYKRTEDEVGVSEAVPNA